MVLVWLSPLQALSAFGLFLVGFSLGPIFPTTIALTSRLISGRLLPSAIGFITSLTSVGAAFFPWLVGNLAQRFSLEILLPLSYLRQMQNSFAGELSLQQALRDLTNVVPGSLHLDGRPQLLLGYLLGEPGQIFRGSTTI